MFETIEVCEGQFLSLCLQVFEEGYISLRGRFNTPSLKHAHTHTHTLTPNKVTLIAWYCNTDTLHHMCNISHHSLLKWDNDLHFIMHCLVLFLLCFVNFLLLKVPKPSLLLFFTITFMKARNALLQFIFWPCFPHLHSCPWIVIKLWCRDKQSIHLQTADICSFSVEEQKNKSMSIFFTKTWYTHISGGHFSVIRTILLWSSWRLAMAVCW